MTHSDPQRHDVTVGSGVVAQPIFVTLWSPCRYQVTNPVRAVYWLSEAIGPGFHSPCDTGQCLARCGSWSCSGPSARGLRTSCHSASSSNFVACYVQLAGNVAAFRVSAVPSRSAPGSTAGCCVPRSRLIPVKHGGPQRSSRHHGGPGHSTSR